MREKDQTTRLITAGHNRMRPIAMTTLAAVFALLPLALGIGQGAAMQQPLAIAIISGLIVLPALLVMLRTHRSADSSLLKDRELQV